MERKAVAQAVRTALLWAGGVAALIAAVGFRTPYLFSIRPWILPAMLGVGVLSTAWAFHRWRAGHRTLAARLLIALWCASLLVGITLEASFRHQKHAVLSADDILTGNLGRHIVIGYTDLGDVEPLAERGLIGGVFVTRRNIERHSSDTLAREIAHLQSLRRKANLPPLIVATDQEGGIVSRLSPPLTALPPLATVATLPTDQRRKAAGDYGAIHGRELAAVGINVNFAPVVDLRADGPSHPLDFYSRIEQRAISHDPSIVAEVAHAYGKALRSGGVTPTLKHFPGLGRVAEDTHLVGASLDTSVADMEGRDWVPFRDVLAHSDAHLMVGHVTLSAIDPTAPASLSRPVIEGLLRERWGFQGLVVTDDLTMGAVFHRGLCTASVAALNASVDLLLVAYDWEQYFPVMDCLVQAARNGTLDRDRLARSRARLNGEPTSASRD